MRVALFHNPIPPQLRSEVDLIESMRAAGWETFEVEEPDRFDVPAGTDVAVVFVKFRALQAANDVDWGGFTGRRVMYEQDAVQNYAVYNTRDRRGHWPPEFRRHRFDDMIVNGSTVADRLNADGVRAHWIPMGVNLERFQPLGRERSGVGYFGTLYSGRKKILEGVAGAGISVEQFSTPYVGLNDEINRFAGILICNMGATRLGGRLNRYLRRPVTLLPGAQVLFKNFEASAAGAAPICDEIQPDLDLLGFHDGKSAVVYSDFGELVDKLRSIDDDQMLGIGAAASALCRERHGWTHRVAAMEALFANAD